jgi:large subunit ribosomal protein L4
MAEELLLDLPVVDLTGKKVGQIFLYKDVFAVTDAHEQAVLDAVLTERANARQATAKTKKRHEVSGGGKKPWRQKARAAPAPAAAVPRYGSAAARSSDPMAIRITPSARIRRLTRSR